jgi:hypothetical protein
LVNDKVSPAIGRLYAAIRYIHGMYRLVECISGYSFKAPNGADSVCSVEAWNKGTKNIVLFRELPDNPGMSVTNASEHLAKLICEALSIPKGSSTRFFECYQDSYDEIRYTWRNGVPSDPTWKHFGDREDFKKLLTNGNNS